MGISNFGLNALTLLQEDHHLIFQTSLPVVVGEGGLLPYIDHTGMCHCTGYAFLASSQEHGIILQLFLGQEQDQAFGVLTAHSHPKIWKVPQGSNSQLVIIVSK